MTTTWSHFFPLVRTGGLFIFLIGVGVVLGRFFPHHRRSLLAAGAASATISIISFSRVLSAPLGAPTALQFWFLFGAIALEAVLIRIAVAISKNAGERSLLLAILLVVGVHFLPMAVAFGPLCAGLGVATSVTAAIGIWIRPSISLNTMWLADGLIKMAFGALMFCAK